MSPLSQQGEHVTGPQLYGMYRAAMLKRHVALEQYKHLPTADKKAWAALARQLSLKVKP
jgi:hypothetical protein